MDNKTKILPIHQPDTISRATEVIFAGGVIAFPTDTVYGIGTTAFSEQAIQKLYQLKKRSYEKPIPVLIGDPEDFTRISPAPSQRVSTLIKEFWPGPLTIIVPLLMGLPKNLSGKRKSRLVCKQRSRVMRCFQESTEIDDGLSPPIGKNHNTGTRSTLHRRDQVG